MARLRQPSPPRVPVNRKGLVWFRDFCLYVTKSPCFGYELRNSQLWVERPLLNDPAGCLKFSIQGMIAQIGAGLFKDKFEGDPERWLCPANRSRARGSYQLAADGLQPSDQPCAHRIHAVYQLREVVQCRVHPHIRARNKTDRRG